MVKKKQSDVKKKTKKTTTRKRTAKKTTTTKKKPARGSLEKKLAKKQAAKKKPVKKKRTTAKKDAKRTTAVVKKKTKKKSTSLGRPRIPADAKLDLVFQKDYQAREVFTFLGVQTIRELEEYGPDEIIDRLTNPVVQNYSTNPKSPGVEQSQPVRRPKIRARVSGAIQALRKGDILLLSCFLQQVRQPPAYAQNGTSLERCLLLPCSQPWNRTAGSFPER